jgi:hypothetical protein
MREVLVSVLPECRDAYDKGLRTIPDTDPLGPLKSLLGGPGGFGRTLDLDVHNINRYSGYDLINRKNVR